MKQQRLHPTEHVSFWPSTERAKNDVLEYSEPIADAAVWASHERRHASKYAGDGNRLARNTSEPAFGFEFAMIVAPDLLVAVQSKNRDEDLVAFDDSASEGEQDKKLIHQLKGTYLISLLVCPLRSKKGVASGRESSWIATRTVLGATL